MSYSSRVVTNLSEVVDTLNVSYSAAIKRGTVEVSGDATTIDETKIKTSDLNAIVSVKVVSNQTLFDPPQLRDNQVQNQTTTLSEKNNFSKIDGIVPNSTRFNEIYGDSFISGT